MKGILNNVLIRPCKSDEVSEFGIIVPESVQERSNRAIIVSHGDGTKSFPLCFPDYFGVGSECIHIKGAGEGTELLIDGVKHYIIKSYDILAFIKNKKWHNKGSL